jgi:CDP-diacylglycerol--glycerol-3-phosphate 3-phosphatidyltransferase
MAMRATIATMFFTIPTIMTWTRIVAIDCGRVLCAAGAATCNLIATVMFMVFAATDWLDGFLARKLNQASAFGAFLDPVADKFWFAHHCWYWCTCSAPMYSWL